MAVQLKANVDDVMKAAKDMLEKVDPSLKGKMNEIDLHMRKQIEDALRSVEEYQRISRIVDQETFTMEVQNDVATVHRGGEQFREPFQLYSLQGISDSKAFQIASLVLECSLIVLDVFGFHCALTKPLTNRIIEEILPVVRKPAFQRYVEDFIQEWNRGGAMNKAKAMYNLVKNTNSAGIFANIVKLAFESMSIVDKTITVAVIVAQVAAAFATDGLALMAKLALVVNDAYQITKKVANLSKMKGMQEALSK